MQSISCPRPYCPSKRTKRISGLFLCFIPCSVADIDFHLRQDQLNKTADTHPIDYAINNWWLCSYIRRFSQSFVLYKEKQMIKWLVGELHFHRYCSSRCLVIAIDYLFLLLLRQLNIDHPHPHVRRLRRALGQRLIPL